MKTLFRQLPWPVLMLLGLLLISVATRAQPTTEAVPTAQPAVLLATYTPAQHLELNWNTSTVDSLCIATDTTVIPRATMLDLRIGRPTPYAIGVTVYWTITQESVNTQFMVERSLEGQPEFHRVALVPGQGAGQALHSYCFVDDDNASSQPSTYRLVQMSPATGRQVSVIQVVPGTVPGPPEPDDAKGAVPSLALD